MLMEETNAAAKASVSGSEEGVRPPPISTRPPTAVRPEAHNSTTRFSQVKDYDPFFFFSRLYTALKLFKYVAKFIMMVL